MTNNTWQAFFLNEGFTMYLQRRITTVVHGRTETAMEVLGGRALLRAMMRKSSPDDPLTRLTVPLADGIDPDDTYTETPYEKGFAFVSYLRAVVGSDEVFDAWLHHYTSTFAFKSITPSDMFECFFSQFPHLRGDWSAEKWAVEEAAEAATWWSRVGDMPADLSQSGVLAPLPDVCVDASGRKGLAYRPGYEFMRWMHAPGWPVYYPAFDSEARTLSAPAEELVAAWLAAGGAQPAGHAAFNTWPTGQKLHFLDTVLSAIERGDASATPAVLAALDAEYKFGVSNNAEIRLRWCQIVASALYEPGFASITEFTHTTGKLKYITPIFYALWNVKAADGSYAARDMATALFADIKPTLHPAVQSRVAGVTGLPLE